MDIDVPLDFALAFWVVHEIPDQTGFFRQIHSALKPGGVLLIAEPKLHVSASNFKKELLAAADTGFILEDEPDIKFSYSAVFEKPAAAT
jgi:predicted methyltransferase